MTPATYTVTAIIVVLTLYGVRASSKTDPQVPADKAGCIDFTDLHEGVWQRVPSGLCFHKFTSTERIGAGTLTVDARVTKGKATIFVSPTSNIRHSYKKKWTLDATGTSHATHEEILSKSTNLHIGVANSHTDTVCEVKFKIKDIEKEKEEEKGLSVSVVLGHFESIIAVIAGAIGVYMSVQKVQQKKDLETTSKDEAKAEREAKATKAKAVPVADTKYPAAAAKFIQDGVYSVESRRYPKHLLDAYEQNGAHNQVRLTGAAHPEKHGGWGLFLIRKHPSGGYTMESKRCPGHLLDAFAEGGDKHKRVRLTCAPGPDKHGGWGLFDIQPREGGFSIEAKRFPGHLLDAYAQDDEHLVRLTNAQHPESHGGWGIFTFKKHNDLAANVIEL